MLKERMSLLYVDCRKFLSLFFSKNIKNNSKHQIPTKYLKKYFHFYFTSKKKTLKSKSFPDYGARRSYII
jgi:hypothetical protein